MTDELNAETLEQGQKVYLLSQEETNYVPLSPRTEACGGCRFFIDANEGYNRPNAPYCHIVNPYPMPIRATGYCDRFEAFPTPEEPESLAEELTEVLEEFRGSAEMKAKIAMHDTSVRVDTKSLTQKFIDGLKSLLSGDAPAAEVGFKVIGNRWIATYSNNFEDLDGEYFPEAAIDAFIDRVDKKEVPMPELWYWHTPIAIGETDAITRIENFVVATGEFRKDKLSQAFKAHFLKTNWKYRVSHGFRFPEGAKQNKAYLYFNTFEISPLRESREANPYTDFELGASNMGGLTPEKRKEFEAFLTPELMDDLVQRLSEKSKELQAAGVSFKERPTLQVVDETARTDIASVKSSMDSLTAQIETLVKALTPADKAKEAEDAKEEKRLTDFKKEVADLVESRMKSFMDLTPRRASKDAATAVDGTHEHVANLKEGQENGKIEGQKGRVMSHAFPTLYSNEGEV